MPPKKLTKAEKERLKKEEAERKAAEEEAKRLQEEEERKQREEEERKAQEERERLQAIEDARFAEETAALDVWLVHQKGCYEEWKSEEWKEKQWFRYLSCEKLPNPLSECELNTYLQCWEQEVDTKDVTVTFTNIGEALRLCEEIQCILKDKYVPSVSDKHRELLDEVVVNMQRILWDKVDSITCCVLEEGNKYLDSESNLKLEHKISKMAFCLWGNLSKNPRLKSFGFNEQEITVEIPKPLLLGDVAVRVMWPPYDPLTPQVEKRSGDDGDKSRPDTEKLSTVADNTESVQLENNENSAVEGDAIESASIAASEKDKESTVQVGSEAEETAVEDTEGSRNTPLDDRQLDSAAGHVYGLEEDEIDTRAFVPAAGGLVMIELLKLPPQPKSINGWTIRQVTDDGVVTQPYPVDPNVTLGSATWTAFNISMKLPEGVMVNEDTKLARWDHSKKIWRTGGISDIKIDVEAHTVSCMAHHFTPIAVMLDRYTNMPYRKWQMMPKGVNHTLYTINGAIMDISIEIKGHQCSLMSATKEDNSPLLLHLVNKWTDFHALQEGLLSAGVNLFPEYDADTYVSIAKKDKEVEAKVCEQMSLVSCVVGFSWSKWSSEVGEQQFVVKACECTTQQTPWELYIAGNRSCKLKMTDSDEEDFSADVAENHEPHPDIFSTLDKVLSTTAKENLKQTSSEHIECVKQWLLSTKPLTFS